MDRRSDPRVEVKLPCHLASGRNRPSVFVGITENMSRSGVLVVWNAGDGLASLPKPGEPLALDIELPANHNFGRRCMHCNAVVARVAAQGGDLRVALQINQMQFRSYPKEEPANGSRPGEYTCRVM
jgi:hypothetical protein